MAEYDRLINWERFYSKYLDNMMPCSTNKITARCPFHDDQHNSFWFNKDNGLWKCEACGVSGNAQTFLERIEKMDSKEAYRHLMKEAGLWQEPKMQKYTVEDYCSEKKLPLDFIKSLGIKNTKNGISIPYYDETGQLITTRIRYHPKNSIRFTWSKGSRVCLYGLWKLEEIRNAGYVILVEGESDAHTLWLHNYPALGIPGASSFQKDWVDLLQGLKIYISKEPDTGGETFVKKIVEAFKEKQASNKLYQFTIKEHKDPSGLYIDNPEFFKQRFDAVLQSAQEIDMTQIQIRAKTEELIPGAPIQLRCPDGWRIKENGIYLIDEKTGALKLICKTPILINNRLKSLETNEEKIEIVFLRDGKWNKLITNRSTVFQTRTITQLADFGLTVSSDNAKSLVKFLAELEAENLDILPVKKSVTQLGWFGNNFLPFFADDIVIDIEPSMQRWLNAYNAEGTLEDWVKFTAPYRENHLFRFYLAASFAAPLLKILNHRTFIVHLWGDSRSGKTAALKAALSVWGDPEGLMASFNATKVGLERMAAFYNDLPLGIDEKQVANNQEFIDNLVYMLSLGTTKLRGSKTGLQAMRTWRSIILTTGEESIIQENSMTGIGTRTLELYGTPFTSELDAKLVHETIPELHGTAGPYFIEKLLQYDLEKLRDRYKEINEQLTQACPNKPGSYLSASAIIYLVDELVSEWIFAEKDYKDKTVEMIIEILNALEDVDTIDITEKGYQFILGWVAEHKPNFNPNLEDKKEQYGIEEDDYVYVLPHILEKAFKEYGLPFRKVLRKLVEQGVIETSEQAGKKTFTVVKWFNHKATRMIKIKLPKEEDFSEPPF